MRGGAARLVGIAQAPVPPGGSVEFFEGHGGVPLRAALWLPDGEPRGSVVVSPGRTEPIEKYFEVVGELLQRGFVVLAHDWRGQGLSHRLLPDRMRGHAADWRHFVADHERLLAAYESRLPRPRFALAHSMGGCFVALALPRETRLDGAVLTSPMFGIQLGRLPSTLARGLAGALSMAGGRDAYVPRGAYDPLQAEFDPDNILTSDRGRWERHRAQLRACPELAVGGVTWGWLDQAFGAMAAALRPAHGAAIGTPLLVLTAGQERLVDNAASRAFAGHVQGAELIEVAASRHEILMETDAVRFRFWVAFDAFVGR